MRGLAETTAAISASCPWGRASVSVVERLVGPLLGDENHDIGTARGAHRGVDIGAIDEIDGRARKALAEGVERRRRIIEFGLAEEHALGFAVGADGAVRHHLRGAAARKHALVGHAPDQQDALEAGG